ncbi:MAG: hypothetical protein K2Y56_12055 [Methylobacterium sp.]|uniref:hypothetical protein n=1 Tax=Methylobacterium sp. TaxID=409 RepID=UPI0025D7D5CE|nr:hypothetical protein [Methylobacterium sp.]MBX9932253.1 hypothetical protein [Methylobacterium sp.]
MRFTLLFTAAIIAASPALSQLSGNPDRLNNLNERMDTQSQIRGIEQRQQLRSGQTEIQMQRNEMARPPAGPPAIVPPRR